MELLAELAARFPKNGDDEKPRLRLLAEDLSETMGALELAAAIKEGRKTWKYLPTLAEIVEAGADYRYNRRIDRQLESDRHQVERLAQSRQVPALPSNHTPGPPRDYEAERAAMKAAAFAKLDAGIDKMLHRDAATVGEPYSWRLAREAGQNVSPALLALRDKLMGEA